MENQMPNGVRMDNMTPNMVPNMNPVSPKSGVGSIIATIIIIAVIILGGLYFWGKRIENEKIRDNIVSRDQTVEETAAVAESLQIRNVNPSDDLSTIEADLNNTNTVIDTNIN